MKTQMIILTLCVCLFATDVPRHTTTYHDTTVTTQFSYVEVENGYVQETSTHTEVTTPRRERRDRGEQRKRGIRIIRGVSLATSVAMIGLSANAASKANEYKELQGVADFNNTMGFTNSADYTEQIEEYERKTFMFLGIGGASLAVFGVTFTF